VEIFGYRNESAKAYAEDLGLALQLTNIIRDVKTDLVRGRIYLPIEDLKRFGVSEDDLRSGQLTSRMVELLRFECDRAHSYYRRAAGHLPREDARSLVAAEIMGGIYFAILRRIERSGYDVFSSRIRVPRPTRAVIALKLWMKALLK
jgi:phytoene synthase